MSEPGPILILDSREPEWARHPWRQHLPNVRVERACLETGDFALKGAESGAVIERKTLTDFLGCIGGNRQHFTMELQRARYCASFCIVIESELENILMASERIHVNSILGTIAAWNRRGFPTIFAGCPERAAQFAWRFLIQQVTEAERLLSQTKASIVSDCPNQSCKPA